MNTFNRRKLAKLEYEPRIKRGTLKTEGLSEEELTLRFKLFLERLSEHRAAKGYCPWTLRSCAWVDNGNGYRIRRDNRRKHADRSPIRRIESIRCTARRIGYCCARHGNNNRLR